MVREYSYEKDGNKFLTPHFQVWEFRSFSDSEDRLTTDKILIDDNLPIILEKIFEKLDCSIIKVTSGYRSEEFDQTIGGFLGFHSKGMAADIMCYDKNNSLIDSKNVCLAAEDLGILGIGYGDNYSHIDTRNVKSFFDETNGVTGINSFYDYFGLKKVEYKVGDVVLINGVYVSSIDDNKLIPLVNKGTITRIIEGARNPYLLNNGDIGWVNDDVIIEKVEGKNIVVGDRVRVLNNIQYNGEPFVVYYDIYDVLEINNDRVVIGIGNVVTCAININNIEKV